MPARAAPISSTPRMKKTCATSDGSRPIYSMMSQPFGVGHCTVPRAISIASSGSDVMKATIASAVKKTRPDTGGLRLKPSV